MPTSSIKKGFVFTKFFKYFEIGAPDRNRTRNYWTGTNRDILFTTDAYSLLIITQLGHFKKRISSMISIPKSAKYF